MQKLTKILFLLSAAAALPIAADCPDPDTPRPLPRREAPAGLEVDAQIDTTMACPSWRWLAIKRDRDSPCPIPRPAGAVSWQVDSLFAADSLTDLPPALRPFCLYEVRSGDARAREALNGNLERLIRDGDLLEVESGCAAVGPMARPVPRADSDDERVWELLQDYFLSQAEALSASRQLDGFEGAANRSGLTAPRVRLSFLDTRPTCGAGTDVPDCSAGRPGRSDHGFALGSLAERLVCHAGDDRRCAAQVTSRLALPISNFAWDDPKATEFDWHGGGYFGTIDQLALAVWDELRQWPGRHRQQLVINLSVAWVGERFGGLEPRVRQMPVPVQALYRALEVASCRGALVVAAAGNRVGGPEIESGPLLPGGWQRRPAPDRERCLELLGEHPSSDGEPSPPAPEPLVYAAGGVHHHGGTLANARPDSEPPRVAYADHAIAYGAKGDMPSILTGSSVATSVVASAAAVVWHHRPELSRAEVMDLLSRSGTPVGRDADVFLGSRAPEVRRIGVCRALSLALDCSDREPCPFTCPRPGSTLELPWIQATQAVDFGALATTADGQDFCQTTTLHFDLEPPATPCPFHQFFGIGARPWTGPQPQNNPCLGCEIRPPPQGPSAEPPSAGARQAADRATRPGYQLRIYIDPEWTGGALEAATLGIAGRRFALGLEALSAGELVLVEGLDPELFEQSAAPVVLHFNTEHGSVESPVFVSR